MSFLPVFLPEEANCATAPAGVALEACPPVFGIDLRIHDKYVDVVPLGQNMVQAAESDVIGPAVAAEAPDRFLDQQVGHGFDFFHQRCLASRAGEDVLYPVAVLAGGRGIVLAIQPGFHGLFEFGRDVRVDAVSGYLHQVGQFVAPAVQRQAHAVAVFGRILEQRIAPDRPCPILLVV